MESVPVQENQASEDEHPTKQRPVSVSVIGWILIVVAAFNLILSAFTINMPTVREAMARNPLPLPVQYIMIYLGLTVILVSGIGMLKGQNWARVLYAGWNALGIVVGLATSPAKIGLIPGILFYLVVVVFLFRPAANRYFSTEGPVNAQSD